MAANTIAQAHIEAIIAAAKIDVRRIGEKTTCVHVTLANGFEITETAACVDPANYSEEIGRDIGLKRIKDRLWLLEGWRLACRLSGEPVRARDP